MADRPFGRLKGLLGRRELPSGEGLLLIPAPSVHTFFMRFAIDVVFLDRDLRVIKVASDLAPWRAAGCRGARSALELPAGECERHGLRPGDRVTFAERARSDEPRRAAGASPGGVAARAR